MRDIAFTVHFTDPPSGPFFVSPSLLFPPSCFCSFTVPRSPPFPQCPLTKFLSREKNLDTPGDILMKNDGDRVSSININRIPLLLILVAESSRGFWLANNREHRQIRWYRAEGNRYRLKIVIELTAYYQIDNWSAYSRHRQWQNTDSILYSWIRRYIQTIVHSREKIQIELTDSWLGMNKISVDGYFIRENKQKMWNKILSK